MGVLDKFIYELLPYTKAVDVKDELVIYDHADGKTKRVRVESLVTDNDFDFPWDSDSTYAKDAIVSFGGDLWESLQSSNLGNMPVEGVWWTKLSKVVGSTVVEYRPGVYGKGLVIVHYPYSGAIAAYAGVKLWELVVPESERPFNSTNIVAEIEAVEGGDPAPKWVPVHPVGGGDIGELTAFVSKNAAGSDIVLTPSDASKWGNILSDGKAALIAFINYIGSRLGQIGDKDVDPSSRADGRFLKYDVSSGKYVHAEVEVGEGGLEDIQGGDNVSVDKTNPRVPIINVSGIPFKATQSEAEEGSNDDKYMTPLKVLQSIAARASEGIEWDNDEKKIKLGGKAEGNINIILGNPDEYERGGYFRVYAPAFPGVINDFKIDNDGTYWGDDLIWWFSSTESELDIRLQDSIANLYLNRFKFGVEANSSYFELIGGGGDEPGELLGFSIKTESPNSFALKSYVDGRVDEIVAGTGAGTFMPVQDITALKAIDTTDSETHPDKWLIHVEDAGLYRLDRQSSATDDGNSVIEPTTGVGRWLKMSSAITSHEMLTGVQGGSVGQHYHLTAAEYLIVAATELAFTNAIKQEIEGKITAEDLPSADLVRDDVVVIGGLLDMTNIDIGDLVLDENTVITSVAGFQEGSKMINLIPNGYTLEWHSSVVNPLNVEGVLSTVEDSLVLILCTSTEPLKIRVKNESNPSPILPKVDVVLNHGNINATGEPWSNLFYLSQSGMVTDGLHNYDLSPSPVEVKINDEFSINVSNSKNSGLSGDVPNTMIKSCFTNSHTHFGRLFYILNLDDQKTYTISMILCNDTVGAKTDISINGGVTQTYDTFELTTWVEIGSFSPTDGIISVGFAKNSASTQDAYLCVTRITEDD